MSDVPHCAESSTKNHRMKKQLLSLVASAAIVMGAQTANAALIDVFAQANSTGGGSGASTGLILTAGEAFTVTVDPNDLWSAGALPRWSNADGLIGDLFATGSDESGQAAGTRIGRDFGLFNGTPFGKLVGSIDGNIFEIGTNFAGNAVASGELLLWYWDSNNGDNSEFITADVRAAGAPVPVPATAALLMVGLLSLLRRRS